MFSVTSTLTIWLQVQFVLFFIFYLFIYLFIFESYRPSLSCLHELGYNLA